MLSDCKYIEKLIDYCFNDRSLLLQALTHPSHAHENSDGSAGNYQRLEFLGDAVLGMVLAAELYKRFPASTEGDLSRYRSQIADQETLASIARLQGVGPYIKLGRGEEQSHGHDKDSILADVLESLIGAVYLDGGLEASKRLILELFRDRLQVDESVLRVNDFKSALQEQLSACRLPAPQYVMVEESGPPHDRSFRFQVLVDGRVAGEGGGRSKKQAQQTAAADALKGLQAR